MPLIIKDREAYLAYLKSTRWQELSLECKSRFNFRCCFCGCNGVDGCMLIAHHRDYTSIGTSEEIEDLSCFCQSCHQALHDWQNEQERLYAA